MDMNEVAELYAREIVTTRVFDAPRALVWRSWSDPEQLKRWWGPRGFTNTFHVFEFRPGGAWRFVMHGPNGTDYPNECMFVEIAEPERIVLDHLSAPRFRLTAKFDEVGEQTKLTFRQLFDTKQTYESIKRLATLGNEQNLDKLAEHLAGQR